MDDAQRLLAFWFDAPNRERWFKPTPEFDQACRAQAGDLLDQAKGGRLGHWCRSAEGTLALVILLDQLPRNIHRGTALAFAFDSLALQVAREAVELGLDHGMGAEQKTFLYLPFEHSESVADQERSVALFDAMGDAEKLDYARRHKAIIDRFGRFPHRNKALGRDSTPEELAFLEEPGSSF